MANLQNHLELFHNKIRVSTEPLTEKRDIILDVIRKYLREKGLPGFELVNQGSYIYGVGIKPLGDNEYDIDVGLAFNISTKDYPDAKVVRQWVLDAVKGHTNKVRDRGPCIRVHYAAGFHVDLVIYSKYTGENKSVENFKLGKKDGSWAATDPKKLKELINAAIDGYKATKVEGNATQIQRVVRFLKRWNDIRNPEDNQDKPSGISLLLLAMEKLRPTLKADNEPDDLLALNNFCKNVAMPFLSRITLNKPTPEYEDVFIKISNEKMTELIEAFKALQKACENAINEPDVLKAAKLLEPFFGDDFPTTEQIRKSEITASLRFDETDTFRLSRLAGLEALANKQEVQPKPHYIP